VKNAAQINAEIKFDERIYEASPRALIQVVSEIEDANDSALIVGHNPGFENLVKILTDRFEAMPTAALAVVDLKIEKWSEVNALCGDLREFFRPKEEMKSRDAGSY
jgi:phosphohistidine phosphatase